MQCEILALIFGFSGGIHALFGFPGALFRGLAVPGFGLLLLLVGWSLARR